jgi:hypothetical protein
VERLFANGGSIVFFALTIKAKDIRGIVKKVVQVYRWYRVDLMRIVRLRLVHSSHCNLDAAMGPLVSCEILPTAGAVGLLLFVVLLLLLLLVLIPFVPANRLAVPCE